MKIIQHNSNREITPFDIFNNMLQHQLGGEYHQHAVPAINISETDKNFVVEMNAAGYDPEKIKVEIDDNNLVIECNEEQEKEENNKKYHHKEMHQSYFRREIHLPRYIDTTHAESNSKNGILTISIPKKQEAQRKILKINTTK